MPVIIKSDDEIALMHESGRILSELLEMLRDTVRPGIIIKELDTILEHEYRRRDVVPTFLGYQGFPAHVCVSVNDEIVHGIPSERALQEGDIVSIDLGVTHNGFVADSAFTMGVGQIGQRIRHLTAQE